MVHLRREQGGQGKAHTLNHGLRHVLAEPWAEAVLIMDADVVYEQRALRYMTRHLADPDVGAVTAYIKEGSQPANWMNKFISYEYIAAQAAARRGQNTIGVLACLAGGAQLHSRENIEAIGGEIDTTSLAEDTFTTFATQLNGKRVVFDGNAVVWAEEPSTIDGLWKQRLRWARGQRAGDVAVPPPVVPPVEGQRARLDHVRAHLVQPVPAAAADDHVVGGARRAVLPRRRAGVADRSATCGSSTPSRTCSSRRSRC